jgi:uncharacterized protein
MGMVERYGEWAVVTGASSGIGRAVAERLARAGLRVVLVARDVGRLDAAAAAIGGGAVALPLDLTGPGAVDRLLAEVDARDAGLVVHAAGFGLGGPHADLALADHLEMLDLNCRTTVELTHGLARRYRARGRGGIVLLGSVVGFSGVPWAAHYAATKAFVLTLGEALQSELAGTGVEVTVIAPGPTHSGFGARAGMMITAGASPDQVARGIVARLGRPGVVLPDWFAWMIRWSTVFAPRRLAVAILGRVMGGMTGRAVGA